MWFVSLLTIRSVFVICHHFCVIIGSCDIILWSTNDSTQIHIVSSASDRRDSAVVIVESMHLFTHCWCTALYLQVWSASLSPSVCAHWHFTAHSIQNSGASLCLVITMSICQLSVIGSEYCNWVHLTKINLVIYHSNMYFYYTYILQVLTALPTSICAQQAMNWGHFLTVYFVMVTILFTWTTVPHLCYWWM